MRKRKKIISKNMIEVLDFHTSRTYRKNGKRVKRYQVTPEHIKKQNEKMAEQRLRLEIDMNFKRDDYYITLTYKVQPESWEQAKKDITNFMRRLKNKCGNSKNLKYIYVAEGKSRIHFHLLVSREKELFTSDLNQLWPYGMHKLSLFQGEAEDAVRLASYFLKEKRAAFYEEKNATFKRRWSSSKNLEKPIVKTEELESDNWSNYIQPQKDYYVEKDSIVEGVSAEGYQYRFYRLIKIKEIGGKNGISNHDCWNVSRRDFRNIIHGNVSSCKRRGRT